MGRKIIVRKSTPNAKEDSNSNTPSTYLTLESVDAEFSQSEIDTLNDFFHDLTLTPSTNEPLEENIQQEIERATQYDIVTVEGLKDWLTMVSVFGWNFIKLKDFEPLALHLLEPSSITNDIKLGMFISRMVNSMKESR
ncbi:hypothetical protein A9Q99_17355 [Gammaproteobacteria bacterium 45_16_T64]|nr:hypothetical protein A9Q99_17355 [Gammaproteobacteria bacterium 45_16_T64]